MLRQLYKKLKAQYHSEKISVEGTSTNCAQQEVSLILPPTIDNGAFDLVRALFSKASAVHRHVGSWAADCFITETLRFHDEVIALDSVSSFAKLGAGDASNNLFCEARKTPPTVEPSLSDENLSAKAIRLVRFLESDLQPDSKVLIFVEQRAVAVALANLLSNYPKLESKLSVGTFIGLSTCKKVKHSFKDVFPTTDQAQVLEDFKVGTKNLIVATSVLEEGIDVSSCQIVICFDPPKNPVSFIQRRGRARQPDSRFILLLSEDEPNTLKLEGWRALEFRASKVSAEHNRGPKELVLQDCHQDDMKFVVDETGYVPLNSDNGPLTLFLIRSPCTLLIYLCHMRG